MVAMSSDTGTTPSTMNVLERASATMFDAVQAAEKFDQCGWAGQLKPVGALPGGCSAVSNMLTNGSNVMPMMATSIAGPIVRSARLREFIAACRVVAAVA